MLKILTRGPVLVVTCLLSLPVIAQGGGKSAEHPNVIMFATDDLNTWVNPLGYSQAITPNLDRLAEMGITFTNAHAPAAYCAPSRSAIWSGLHAHNTGCYNDELYFFDMPELVSMQTAFDQAGYNTYGAGKLYHHRAGSFDTRGWDTYFSRSQEIRDWGYEMGYRGSDVPWPDPHPYSPVYTDPRSNRYLEPGETIDYGAFLEFGPIAPEEAELIPDAVRTNWVVDLLGQEHTEPFFIGLGLYTPHFPNYAPQEFFDLYDRETIEVPYIYPEDLDDLPDHIRNRMTNRLNIQANLETIDAVEDAILGYLACVSFADAMLGRVLDALEASPYKDSTVVIFWSDQGYHHGEKGQWGKHTLWQETSHVPFIIAGNGLPRNVRVDSTVSLIDMYPTLIELCNLPEQHQMDGVSLVPVLNNPSSAEDRNVLISYMYRGGYALINSKWRYIQYHDGSEELYNLLEDPNEWFNLLPDESYRPVINEMKQDAPAEFKENATPRNSLKLVIVGDTFYWESNDKSKAAEFVNAHIIFDNPIYEQGISFEENIYWDSLAFTLQAEHGGQDCRYIPEGKVCYFDVDDQYFDVSDNNVTFHITYFDGAGSNVALLYNATGSASGSVTLPKNNTNQWITATIVLADAAFENLLEHQADFSISGDVYLRSVTIEKPPPSDASVVFADEIIEQGMEYLVGTDINRETYTLKATKGGLECRHIPRYDKRKYGYFTVNDAIVSSTDHDLTFEVTYWDEGAEPFMIQYNSTSENYEKVNFTRKNTKTWITKTVALRDAAFNNLQNNQSDFRIMGEAYVRRVALRVGIEDPIIPDIPVEYVIPQEPEDTTTTDTTGTGIFNLEGPELLVDYQQGMLRVQVPDAMLHGELIVYNSMGQAVIRKKVLHTEERIQLSARSKLFIVLVHKNGTRISRKISGI